MRRALAAVAAIGCLVVFTAAGGAATQSSASAPAGSFPAGVDLGLTPEQQANATIGLTVADTLHAGTLARVAEMTAALGESDLTVVPNGQGSIYCGVWQADPSNIPCDDTRQQAESFLSGGKGFQAGGAMLLAREHPGMTPGTIATLVEASGQPGGWYDVNRNGGAALARRIVDAWAAGGQDALAQTAGTDLIAEAQRMVDARQPYHWGGGHLSFDRDGPWDCSGAVSWLTHYLGLLKTPMPLTSTGFMSQGVPGRGREFTIYANPVHVFIVIEAGPHAGQAWGTATRAIGTALPTNGGPNWHYHATGGFTARHFPGH